MNEINSRYSPRATLAALGLKLRALDLLATVKAKLRIHQKTVRHTLFQKLEDALITILAGAHGLSEINTRLRWRPGSAESLRQGRLCRPVSRSVDTQCRDLDQRRAADAGARRHP